MDNKQDNTEIIDKVLSGARWSAFFRLFAQGISWIITLIVVRFISPTDYGLNSMLEASLGLLMLFSTLGLDDALMRSKNVEHYELQSVFGYLLIVNGLLFLGYFFGSGLIAGYFKEPRLDQLAKALAVIFLLKPFRIVPNVLLARDLRFKLKAFVDLVSGVIAAITTLIMAIMGAGVWALVMGVLVNNVLAAIMLMIIHPWFVKPSFNYSVLRDFMAFGRIMVLGDSVILISEKLISIIAGPILGAKVLGIFSVAFGLAVLPLSKVMPILSPIIFPAFAKFQDNLKVATYYFQRSLGIVSLGIFPVMIGTACIAHELTSTIFGNKWQAVAVPLTILSLSMLFRVATNMLRPVMSSIGHPKLSLKSKVLTLIVQLPLILIGVNYGVMGLVFAVLITEITVMFATIRTSSSILDTSLKSVVISLRPAIFSSMIMAASVLGVKVAIGSQHNFLSLMLMIGTGILSYYISLNLLYRDFFDAAKGILLGRR